MVSKMSSLLHLPRAQHLYKPKEKKTRKSNPYSLCFSSGLTSMATQKFLVYFLFLSLIFFKSTATELSDSEVSDTEVSDDSSLIHQLDKPKSKISLLESGIDERAQELKSKEETIKELEKINEEKSTTLASLQSEILLLKEKLSLNAKEHVGETDARATQLQEQINNLKKEIEAQNKKKDVLEDSANDAGKRIQDLSLKLENLHRTDDEQKFRIRKTQRALQVAEEELMKAKVEASSVSNKLNKVREAWIPPWFSVHFAYCQSFVMTHWNKHGKPALDLTVKKALETKSEFDKWVEPHVYTCKSKWIPVLKRHCLAFISDFGLHLQSLTTNAIEMYHTSKKTIEPQVQRLQKVLDPYFQEAQKFLKPYVDQFSSVMKPHVDKARVFMKPYTKKMIRSYKKFVKNATRYHRRVQVTINDLLKSHDFTRPLATKELAWYLASALMVLPVIFGLNMVSAIFSKKPKKHIRGSHSSHIRRRAKRGHSER